jgi:Na+/H+ antiporter NhaD/arsenite permease-like protein
MWAKILQGKGLQVVYREFAWNGLCVMIPVTFISLLVLYAVT